MKKNHTSSNWGTFYKITTVSKSVKSCQDGGTDPVWNELNGYANQTELDPFLERILLENGEMWVKSGD